MGMRLSEHAAVSMLDPSSGDVGGTTLATGWVSMKNYARAMAHVELGTWDSSDDLDHCRIEQAVNSSGGSSKELTTDASGGNYDTDSPVDADGNSVTIEIRAEDLDVDGGFNHIRFVVGEDGDTGVDQLAGFLMRYGYAHPQKEVLAGAASAGAVVYVDSGT